MRRNAEVLQRSRFRKHVKSHEIRLFPLLHGDNIWRTHTAEMAALATARDPFARLRSPVGRVTALYAHIPFCRSRCAYCGFVSSRCHSESDRDEYVGLLGREAEHLARRGLFAGRTASMLYIGGGTPTVLSPRQLRQLTRWLRSLLPLEPKFEFTCEGHPRTLLDEEGQERLAALVEGGVTRLSVGVQDFVPEVLRACNRYHTPREVREGLRRARTVGVPNINLDFIYGLPGQTLATWTKTLQQALELRPENLTVYRVQLKAGTSMALRSKAEFPYDCACTAMRESAIDTLTGAGYVHMLANQFPLHGSMFYDHFALPGWTYRYGQDDFLPCFDFIGMGVSAISMLEDRMYTNLSAREDYDAAAARDGLVVRAFGPLGKNHQRARMLVLGLRRPLLGVSPAEFRAHFGREPAQQYPSIIGRLIDQQLVESNSDRLRLTRKGLMQLDAINTILAPLYAALAKPGRAPLVLTGQGDPA